MNKEGAMAGMLSGLFVTLFYVFAHKGLFFIKGTGYLDLIGGPNSFFGITPEAFGAIGAIVNFAVAFVVDKIRITSYNVCYTKLLRPEAFKRARPFLRPIRCAFPAEGAVFLRRFVKFSHLH